VRFVANPGTVRWRGSPLRELGLSDVLAIADLRENAHTRAGDAVWVPPSSVDRRITMSVGAIPTTDRRPTTRPGNLFRSVTQPVVAAPRVDAATDGCRTTLWLQPVKPLRRGTSRVGCSEVSIAICAAF